MVANMAIKKCQTTQQSIPDIDSKSLVLYRLNKYQFVQQAYLYKSAFGRVVPNNGLGLPSPSRDFFLLDTQINYPALESHVPSQPTVANANAPMASTSAQRASYMNQFIEHTHPYESLSQYIDSLFYDNPDFCNYYVKRTTSLYPPVIDFSILKTPNKANHAMNSSSVQSNQQLNLVLEQHQTSVEPSITHPTTNTSPQSSVSRSTSGATTARWSHDNTLLTVTQEHSATDAITTLSCPENIKEETELHQSSSFAMRAPELTRSQSIGMDDLSPHYDQEMSGDDDSYDYLDAEDLVVPDASITAIDVGLDITPIEQGVRFPGDQYTPVWVRFQGKRRQGRCEQCVHLNRKILWFKLRTSQYLYHKLNAHGIIHATGRPFGKPTDIRLNVNGTREGWCHVCNTFQMAYTPRSRPPMSRWAPWYRHVYNVK
ncbi:unnamed protein product [Umbelopsis ramanniana]